MKKIILPLVTLLLLSGAEALADSVPIRNDTVWKDDRGEEIMCQGGSLCKFGDTFYFYGWGDYPGDNRKDTITCYSSPDLASWKFENHIFTRDATNLTLIVPDRLHVIYNATTKNYVMIGKHILPVYDPKIPGQPRVTGGVSFFTGETPTNAFLYLGHEMLPAGASPGTDYHRDLAAFQDDDGAAYVVSSHDQHTPHRNIMITRLKQDYLHVERMICEIPLTGEAREAPYIIKLKGRYWLSVSGHGVGGSAWNGSPTSYTTAGKLEGPWAPFKKLACKPESKDCFNAQNDFLFEVRGSAGSFVLWGGDRWSQRTKLGIGKNVWLPLQWNGDEPLLKWYPTWNVDAAAGTWTSEAKAVEARPAANPLPASAATAIQAGPGRWWRDVEGKEMVCFLNSVLKVGDTFYMYGEWCFENEKSGKNVLKCYSSKDMVRWKFENDVLTQEDSPLINRGSMVYNPQTKQYVYCYKYRRPMRYPGWKFGDGVLAWATNSSPTGRFKVAHKDPRAGIVAGEVTLFQENDGKAYALADGTFDPKEGKRLNVYELSPDYCSIVRRVCELGTGHEAVSIHKINGKYWAFGSGLNDWYYSPTSCRTAENIAGPWTPWQVVETDPPSPDAYKTQDGGLIFEVKGSEGSFHVWTGVRYYDILPIAPVAAANSAPPGIRPASLWLPLQWKNGKPLLKYYQSWTVDAAAGTWTANPKTAGAPPAADSPGPKVLPASRAALEAGEMAETKVRPPVVSAASSDAPQNFSEKLQPLSRILDLMKENFCVWSCAPIYGPDGKVHVFFDRWKIEKWNDSPEKCCAESSEIAHAIADRPEGPYRVVDVALKPRGGTYWDGTSIMNAKIYPVENRYALFYTGMNVRTSPPGRQSVGLAVANSLDGPWVRISDEAPLLAASSNEKDFDSLFCNNPAMVRHPNGQFWVYYRGRSFSGDIPIPRAGNSNARTRVFQLGLTVAYRLEGPYRKYGGNPVIDLMPKRIEDPFVWYQDETFHMLCHDLDYFEGGGGVYMTSVDGIRWSRPAKGYPNIETLFGIQQRLEEPVLLLRDGKPDYLFCNRGGSAEDQVFGGFVFKVTTSAAESPQPVAPTSAATSAVPIVPKIAGDWWTVAGNPDLGELTGPEQQPVDFSIWQAADGTWQLWSCIRNTKVDARTRLLHRWEGKQLTDTDWKPMGIALRADPNCGEESVQSPYVFKDGGVYHMFYGDWNNICRATSQDGKNFTRGVGPDGKTGMFGEGIGNFARDPMVLRVGGIYYCYYTANPEGGKGTGKGVVFCRTSQDLMTWSESKRVAYGGAAGTNWTSAECPFVTVHDGWYYLFRTQGYPAPTRIYRSQDPMNFGINDDQFLVGTQPVAAPEIIEHDGQTYLASLLPSLKGIRIAKLTWKNTEKQSP